MDIIKSENVMGPESILESRDSLSYSTSSSDSNELDHMQSSSSNRNFYSLKKPQECTGDFERKSPSKSPGDRAKPRKLSISPGELSAMIDALHLEEQNGKSKEQMTIIQSE